MTARRVSREPYRVRRDRREVLKAVGVAVLIVLLTAVTVWILAPNDESNDPTGTPTNAPSVTTTNDPIVITVPTTTADPAATTPTGG